MNASRQIRFGSRLACRLAILSVFCLDCSSPSPARPTQVTGPDRSIVPLPVPQPPTGVPNALGLQYFGYWRDSELFYDNICGVQDHANFSMMDTLGSGSRVAASKIAAAEMIGLSAWGVTGPSALGGFLVLDDADLGMLGPLWSARKATLEALVPDVLRAHPAAHPMINLDGTFMEIPGFALPVGYDWIGIECYGRFGLDAASCRRRFEMLKRLLPPNGRVWIILPAESEFGDEIFLAQNAEATYQWARTESQIIGLIAFVFQSELLFPARLLGARDLPILMDTLRRIGQSITGRTNASVCFTHQ